MKKIAVTVVVPVKNEESNLRVCLSLLSDFEQVMVIDSNSTDQTQEIAKEYGTEIHQFNWNGRFPKKRNWVLRNLEIRNDWVLFLDADEFITEAFKIELQKKIKQPKINGYRIKFLNFFMGKLMKYGDPFIKLSLFRMGKGEYERIEEKYWSRLDMEVHEKPVVEGEIGLFKAAIIHNDFKDLERYFAKHNEYSSWEANRFFDLKRRGLSQLSKRQTIKYRLMRWGILPVAYFFGAYIWKLGFLDGKVGFYYHLYRALYFLQIQNKVEELSFRKKSALSKGDEPEPIKRTAASIHLVDK